jgi:exodeoxyribonuclease VII large subunit
MGELTPIEPSSDQNLLIRKYNLREITSLIKESLLDLSGTEFWVQAHLIADRGTLRSGHYYGELMDVDEAGNQIARIRITIWRHNYNRIIEKLREAGMPDALQSDSEVCALCSVRYHEVYGLSLDVFDIDPFFGESHIDRNRRLIVEKLTKENILKKNAEACLPVAPQRLGLITSKESAAYNDFVKTLFNSAFSFQVILADCPMQGEETERGVVSSIQLLCEAGVEIICIVRGGGSQADLAGFDNEEIARAIINCPMPVWVGIGHEIDTGVLDVVAHSSFKTPTSVAEALVSRLKELQSRLEIAANRLQHIVDRQMALSSQLLHRKIVGALNGFRKQYELKQQQFTNDTLKTRVSSRECFSSKKVTLSNKSQRLRDLYFWSLDSNSRQLKENSNRIQLPRYLKVLIDKEVHLVSKEKHFIAMMPAQILKRGYTMTRNLRGEILRSIAQVQKNETIKTQFVDGYAQSIVQEMEDVGYGK